MSWWHRNYQDKYVLEEIIENLKHINIWYDSVPTDNAYWKSCEKYQKVPKWVWKSLEIYKNILHEIDWDVSWDSTIKKWYFDKQSKKLQKLLDSIGK